MASLTPLRPLATTLQPRTLQQTTSFSTTTTLLTKTIQPQRIPKDVVPPYPYGPRLLYKQANSGLYGVTRIQTGNNVSEKWNVKTARFWRPNIHIRYYFIESLNVKIKTKVSMRVVKSIEKAGSIEAYLLKDKSARIKELGPAGWNLRWLVMQTEWHQKNLNEERVKLGIPQKKIVDNSKIIEYAMDWATPGKLSVPNRKIRKDLKEEDAFEMGMDDQEFANLPEEQQAAVIAQMEEALKAHEGKQSHMS